MPSPSASTRIRKNRVVSISFPGTKGNRFILVPVNQVGKRIALFFFFVELSKSLIGYFTLVNRAAILQFEISDERILEMSDRRIPGLRSTDSWKTGSQDCY
ncbi:MAG: hypothetical protein WDM78_02135 [Puia sp.]